MPSAVSPEPQIREDVPQVSDLSAKLPPLIPRRGPVRRTPPKPTQATTTAPQTPPLSPPPAAKDLHFLNPTRRILSPHDHELFLKSSTYTLIVSFIFTLSDAVKDVPISDVSTSEDALHPTVRGVLHVLKELEDTTQQCPPDENGGSRFGNPAFREYIDALTFKLPSLHTKLLDIPSSDAANPTANTELTTYLISSLGSSQRIDYGSGHELHFFIYLLCLHQLSLLPASTFPSLVLILFPRYLHLMRTLQATYYLEPAGSHGVWGLDDYHFLPFLFGASQLSSHSFLRPLAIHSEASLQDFSADYLYLDMVRHVNATKTVQGLRWHSPMLDDISGVREGWGKIEGGMRKMFLREVVGKLVVMQHFLFGGLVPAVEGMSEEGVGVEEEEEDGHEGHAHNGKGWGDCCGIAVPSNAGAVGEMKKRMGEQGLRRLPFD